MEYLLIHEMVHVFDIYNGISKYKQYHELADKFPNKFNPLKKNDDKYYAEDFAYSIEYLFKDKFDINDKTIYLYKLLEYIN